MMVNLYISILLFGVFFSVAKATSEDEVSTATEQTIKYVVTQEAWFDFAIMDHKGATDYTKTGRVVIGLFGDICPMTVTNFVQLTRGFKRDKINFSYKGTPVHRIVRDFVVQTGDFLNGDGTGSKSIYGDKFIDENFVLSHRSPGWVSMANYGEDTNGSQFFVTLVPARWLDGHHVVFGRVLSGMDFLRDVAELETYKGTTIPKKHVEIVDCGTFDSHRYELKSYQLDMPGDIKESD